MEREKNCEDCNFYQGICIAYDAEVKQGEEVTDLTIAKKCQDFELSLDAFIDIEEEKEKLRAKWKKR